MNIALQTHLYWKFIHRLVVHERFRVFERSKDKKQIWLEKETEKGTVMLRIARVEYDWFNLLEKDQLEAEKAAPAIKKALGTRKVHFYNVYITSYPPVDMDAPFKAVLQSKVFEQSFLLSNDGQRGIADSPEGVLEAVLNKKADWIEEPSPWNDGEPEEELKARTRIYREEVEKQQEEIDNKERSLFFYGKPLLTYALLASVFVMFFLLEQAGGSMNMAVLIDYGAKYNPAIMDGEWWRLLTAAFLHIGFFHLFMNSLALFYLGGAVERIFGTTRFLFIYAAAAVVGSLASFSFNEQVSAGASGAIFGCFGALLYFGWMHKKLFFRTMGFNVLVILAINLVFGFVVPAIDNGAHIGGLVGGFLAAGAVHLPKSGRRKTQLPLLIGTIALTCGLYWFGMNNENKAGSAAMDQQMARDLAEEGEYEEARNLLLNTLENSETEDAQTLFLLGYTESYLENYEEAGRYFEQTIEMEPEFAEAYYNLALTYIELAMPDEAEEALSEAKRTAGDRPSGEELDFGLVEERLEEIS
ncbi:rhomboid family intramembrane serine protease [Sinobaca sp. H24]|uniref:rhomboid family intramembrane serine protease n=1 Tax=Sinobaca sp. H24 TaxID=2923376 RepID=UPI002079B34E|nr:rhomboid family intramembrane serine protease [Sinobaca sp. H24]